MMPQQTSSTSVLIIIPAFNEEESIVDVAHSVHDAGYDLVVVNDGSTDATLEICKDHDIPVLNLASNLGIGGAVQTGHIYAYENGYDIDIQFDGDGQHDIGSIPALVEAIEQGANLAIGSRFVDKNKETFKSTGLRRLGIKWLSFIIKLMTGARVYDVTSGFRACDRRMIELYSTNYPIDYPEPESIAIAMKNHMAIAEVPVTMNERQGGISSISAPASVYYMIKVSLAIIIQSMTRRGTIRGTARLGGDDE